MRDVKLVVKSVRSQMEQLIGVPVERIVEIRKQAEGWYMECEILERADVPSSMDVIALYGLEVSGEGHVEQFSRKQSRHRSEVIREK